MTRTKSSRPTATSCNCGTSRPCLALSRQPLPTLDRSRYAPASGVAQGPYVLADAPGGNPELILIASGSEVCLAVDAHEQLLAEGIRSRVISMPSWDIFELQCQEYRDSVMPPRSHGAIAIEQGSTFGWEHYVGTSGKMIGMKTFGASAPLKEVAEEIRVRAGQSDDRRQGTARAEVRMGPCCSGRLLHNRHFRPIVAELFDAVERHGPPSHIDGFQGQQKF